MKLTKNRKFMMGLKEETKAKKDQNLAIDLKRSFTNLKISYYSVVKQKYIEDIVNRMNSVGISIHSVDANYEVIDFFGNDKLSGFYNKKRITFKFSNSGQTIGFCLPDLQDDNYWSNKFSRSINSLIRNIDAKIEQLEETKRREQEEEEERSRRTNRRHRRYAEELESNETEHPAAERLVEYVVESNNDTWQGTVADDFDDGDGQVAIRPRRRGRPRRVH